MKTTGWRRIASAIWHAPDDPQIYGVMELDATRLLAYVAQARAAGVHLTPTHLVGRALARALREVPDLNVRLVLGRMVPRKSVDVFFITAVGSGRDLSGVKVEHADEKSAVELAQEVSERASALRGGRDANFARTKRMMEHLPHPVLRPLIRLFAWLAGGWGLDLPGLGLPGSPFGGAMVSNVASFGLPMGFSPLAWMYNAPLLVLTSEIVEKPVAVDGQVEIRKVLPLTATIDHRYVDGFHIGALVDALRGYLDDPARFEPPLELRDGQLELPALH